MAGIECGPICGGPTLTKRFWLGGRRTFSANSTTAALAKCYVLPMYSSEWTLELSATPLLRRAIPPDNARGWALLCGSLVTVLMSLALAVQIRARLRQEQISGDLRLALNEVERAREGRIRLSRDLHDGAMQSLYALQLGIGTTIERIESKSPEVARHLTDSRNVIKGISASCVTSF